MEPLGAISDRQFDWNVVDESELMMAQLLGTCQGTDYDASCDGLHNVANSSLYWHSTSNLLSPPTEFNSYEELISDAFMVPAMKTSSDSMDTRDHLPEEKITTSTQPVDFMNYQFDVTSNTNITTTVAEHTPQPKIRKIVEYDIGTIEHDPKKKARTSTQNQKRVTNARGKKARKKEESNASYSSEDNSNASQEPIGHGDGNVDGTSSSNMKGKTRATDPQSLYARKRRERINERLKILQNLVPNGTKVDISTMLEEAVQYVKFLQLQIKLLSSDDMWMYAPLASNWMDIGLDPTLHLPQQRQ